MPFSLVPESQLLRPKSGDDLSPAIEAGLMEYPPPGLYLHLDLGVRGADDHVAYRTMPTPPSPEPSPRDGRRQGPALNLCRDGLIENAHRFLLLVYQRSAGSAFTCPAH
jgi:hypothetical protein